MHTCNKYTVIIRLLVSLSMDKDTYLLMVCYMSEESDIKKN